MGAIAWKYWFHTNHCIILFESLSRPWSGNFPVNSWELWLGPKHYSNHFYTCRLHHKITAANNSTSMRHDGAKPVILALGKLRQEDITSETLWDIYWEPGSRYNKTREEKICSKSSPSLPFPPFCPPSLHLFYPMVPPSLSLGIVYAVCIHVTIPAFQNMHFWFMM